MSVSRPAPGEADRIYAKTVGSLTLAKMLGISETRIHHLINEGVLHQRPNASLELGPSVSAYIAMIKRSKNVAPEGSARANEEEEKALKARISRELEELKLRKAKSQLYQADDVNAHVAHMIMVVRTRFLGIPSKLSPLLIGIDDYHDIETLIKSEITEALAGLAEYAPPNFDEEGDDESGILMGEECQ